VQTNSNSDFQIEHSDLGLQRVVNRIIQVMERDDLVQETTDRLRDALQVDRVVLYYFYRHWEGRVTFESLSQSEFSILGSTGPDECFNGEYAKMYEEGRVRAIEDIETAAIADCHRDFLRTMKVQANLVVPVLTQKGLWGLLVAHHCRSTHPWSESDVKLMQDGATTLATAPSIRDR
jgi:GAF domain-containing protein